MYHYNVVLVTGDLGGAGTSADVAVELRGQNGSSGWMVLDHPSSDDRERGDSDYYGIALSFAIGDVTEIAFLLRDADGDRPDWFLDHVALFDFNVPGNAEYQFFYRRWIAIKGQTEWFAGPVLDKRHFVGPMPYATWVGALTSDHPGNASAAVPGASGEGARAVIGSDITGYQVRAVGGRIGKVLGTSRESGVGPLMVVVGSVLRRRTVRLPGCAVRHIDHSRHRVYLGWTRRQVRTAPRVEPPPNPVAVGATSAALDAGVDRRDHSREA